MSEWIALKDRVPLENEVVDIWSALHGRLTDYVFYKSYNGIKGNNFFAPIESGYMCVRDCIYWMPIPKDPTGMK